MQVFQIEGLSQDMDVFPDDSDLGHLRISSMLARPWGIGENLFLYISDDLGIVSIVKFVPKTAQSSGFPIERDAEVGRILPIPDFSADGEWYTSGMDVCRVDDGTVLVEIRTSQLPDDVEPTYDRLMFSHDKKTVYGIPNPVPEGCSWQIHVWPFGGQIPRQQRPVRESYYRCVGGFEPEFDAPVAMAVSPDGKRLSALVHCGWQIYFWQFEGKPDPRRFVRLQETVFDRRFGHLAYSLDSRWLVASGTETVIFTAKDMELHAMLDCGPVRSLAITRDSQTVLTVNGEHRLEQWHIPSGEKLREYSFEDLIGPAECVTVSPDGFTAYVAGTEGRFLRWDLE